MVRRSGKVVRSDDNVIVRKKNLTENVVDGGRDLKCCVVRKFFSCANFASRVTGSLTPPGFLLAPPDEKSCLRSGGAYMFINSEHTVYYLNAPNLRSGREEKLCLFPQFHCTDKNYGLQLVDKVRDTSEAK